jgi:hypothetical protein
MPGRKRAGALGLVLVASLGFARPVSGSSGTYLQVAPLIADGLTAHIVRGSLATPTQAPVEIREARRPAPLIPLYISFAALQVADARSSYSASRQGLVETNPLMGPIVNSPGRLVAMKAATTAGTILATEFLWRQHPRAAVIVMAVITSSYSVIVAHNYRLLH